MSDGEGTTPPAPLTQADIPAVVRAVAEALKDQLKDMRSPAPSDAGSGRPVDPGEGTAPRPGKPLLRLAQSSAAKFGLYTI